MLHELGHSYYDFYAEKEGIDQEEESWVIEKVENQAAKKLPGESVRPNHGGYSYRTQGPTTTKPYQKKKQKNKKE